MRQRLAAFHGRLLSAFAIGLCTLLVAVVAATLEPSVSTAASPDPPESAPSAGVSLIALLYRLINAVLGVFGISLDPPSGRVSGSALGFVFRLLRTIYQYRLAIAACVVLLTVLGLLSQVRHRLAVPRILQSSGGSTGASATSSTTEPAGADWPPAPDPDSVQEAWVAMVRRVDEEVETPSSRTPAEWRAVALASGFPADAVETITSTFRAVRYGTATETEAHRERVRTALDALDARQEAADE